MATTRSAVLLSCTLLAGISVPVTLSAQSNVRDRIVAAIEAVEEACQADIAKFCGNVTPGEGRVLMCMQAHDDKLSRNCQYSLYRASRNLERGLDRVERIADTCWTDIEAKCGDADNIGRCVMEKSASLSPSCQTVADGIRRGLQGLASLRGMPAYSADEKDIGRVVGVLRDPDGKVRALHIEIGRNLGLGDRVVKIDRDAFEQLVGRIKLRQAGDDVRSLPDAKPEPKSEPKPGLAPEPKKQ